MSLSRIDYQARPREPNGVPHASEPSMSPSSERLVVFVTPAQKRVLTARAARMGISLSELVRRAVLAFDDTGEEVRAAGLVDRLGAVSEASRNDALRRLAQAQTHPGERAGGRARSPGNAPPNSTEAADTAPAPGPATLPVAAAVAQALVARESAPCDERADAETEALVARVIHAPPEGSV